MGGNQPQPPYGDYASTGTGPVPMLHSMVERLSRDGRRMRAKLAGRAATIRRMQARVDELEMAHRSTMMIADTARRWASRAVAAEPTPLEGEV